MCKNIKWITDNIHIYGGNPQNIFLLGYSAGAHIVSLIAVNDIYLKEVGLMRNLIKGVVCMSGMYCLVHLLQYPIMYRLLDRTVFKMNHADPESVKNTWPITSVRKDVYNPRFLITVAQLDWFIEDHSYAFIEKLISCNVDVECKKLPGTTHLTVNKHWDSVNEFILLHIVEFIEK